MRDPLGTDSRHTRDDELTRDLDSWAVAGFFLPPRPAPPPGGAPAPGFRAALKAAAGWLRRRLRPPRPDGR